MRLLRGLCVGILIGLIVWRFHTGKVDYEVAGFGIILMSLLGDWFYELRSTTRWTIVSLLFEYAGYCLAAFLFIFTLSFLPGTSWGWGTIIGTSMASAFIGLVVSTAYRILRPSRH